MTTAEGISVKNSIIGPEKWSTNINVSEKGVLWFRTSLFI